MKYDKNKNYCTFSPDRLWKWDWGVHCYIHDSYYKRRDKTITRKQADIKLREGMKKELPWFMHWLAWLYYLGVRLLSKAGWKRWEYNWDKWIGIFAWKKK